VTDRKDLDVWLAETEWVNDVDDMPSDDGMTWRPSSVNEDGPASMEWMMHAILTADGPVRGWPPEAVDRLNALRAEYQANQEAAERRARRVERHWRRFPFDLCAANVVLQVVLVFGFGGSWRWGVAYALAFPALVWGVPWVYMPAWRWWHLHRRRRS
jgi:hypothetical protein